MRYKETELGFLPKKWNVVKIKDVGEVIGGGTPSTKKDEYYGGHISWITPKDLSGHDRKLISRGERNITDIGLQESSAKLLPKGSVLLSSRAPIGYVAIANNELSTNQGFKSIICDNTKISNDYLYYVLKINKDRLESVASGSTFKEVSGKNVKEFKIPLPPLKDQKIISVILSNLDKKIELNSEIIFNLEELAQTLFKRWFVDFEFPNENGDPYMSSGGKMVESELGLIPEGWEVGGLNSIFDITMGQSPKSNTYNTEGQGLPLINGASDFKNGSISPSKYTADPKKIARKGDLVFGVRATVGNVTYVNNQYAVGRGAGFARIKETTDFEFGYFSLISVINYLESTASGSVYINISKNDLINSKVIKPSYYIVEKFHRTVSSAFNKWLLLYEENSSLKELRDTLLPKLLSGEIEIPDESEVNDDVPVS